jgi:hypothetical protein
MKDKFRPSRLGANSTCWLSIGARPQRARTDRFYPRWVRFALLDEEWGYFSLAELMAARGPLNLAVERDVYLTPAPFSEVRELHRKQFGG